MFPLIHIFGSVRPDAVLFFQEMRHLSVNKQRRLTPDTQTPKPNLMKKLILLVALLSMCWSSLLATKVYYTSGEGQGLWQDPNSWILGGSNETPSTAPSADDHVVIRHYLVHRITGLYEHRGNIKVTNEGMYEVAKSPQADARFQFAGGYFEVVGTFFSATDLALVEASNLVVHRSAYFYLSGSLFLEGQGGLISESETCGSLEIHRDLALVSPEAYVSGRTRLIVSGTLRIWDEVGQEVNPETGISEQVTERLGANVTIYANLDACGADLSGWEGTSEQLATGVTWASFDVEGMASEAHLTWYTERERFVQDFVVERSSDGISFETVAQVDARGRNGLGETYHFVDRLPEQGTVTYRIRQNTLSGAHSYSEPREVSRSVETTTLNLYPNPCRSGRVNLLGKGLQAETPARLTVRTPAGNLVYQATVSADHNGRVQQQGFSGLTPGLYLVMMEQGDTRLVQRLTIY